VSADADTTVANQPGSDRNACRASTLALVGGWNARDNLAEMALTDAVIVDNFFLGTANAQLRWSSTNHATGVGAAI
jgi:hypothetical protein